MVKRALSAVVGILSLCFSLSAFALPDFSSALNSSLLRLPPLTLSDGQPFSFSSTFNSMEATTPDFLPAFSVAAITVRPPKAAASASLVQDSSKEVVDVRPPKFTYAGGEIGAFYGRSSGKFGREVEAGYILGEVGDDRFQISAGASYEHSSGRVPRFGR